MKKNGFLLGLMCGMALWGFAPTVQATVDYVVAKLSPQSIYLDGNAVDWTVYNVADQNYIRLADLCPELGVGISWDSATNSVLLTSNGTTPETTPVVTTPTIATTSAPSNTVVIPHSDEKLNLKVGDTVLCDDGYHYEITDMSKYENNSFQKYDVLPELPSQVGDWSNLPYLELPDVEVRHYKDEYGDALFITNLYEMRRMQYVLYNLMVKESSIWNGTKCYATVNFGFDTDTGVSVMWPWDEQQLVDLFQSRPMSNFRVEAFDYYENGVFQYTRYKIRAW